MRLNKTPFVFSLLLGIVFMGLGWLVRPLWYDVSDFLGTRLPVMAILETLAVLFTAYCWRSIQQQSQHKPGSWKHLLAVIPADLFMLALLHVFFTELGAEQVMIWRNLWVALPCVLWLGAAGLALWKPPHNPDVRLMVIAGLVMSAAIYSFLPARVANTSRPVVFFQQDGLEVVWGTNMPAAGWVDFGLDATLGDTRQEQVDGLKVIGDRIQQVFLPMSAAGENLFLRTGAEGIRNIHPIDADKAGQVNSPTLQVDLPNPGSEVSFVAFSDLHEQNSLYTRLAEHIDWLQVDLSVYLGDLLNNVSDASQVNRSILDLPTGGLDLPRVFVRGNHETRGPAARSLAGWLIPPGGKYYYTFQAGNAFFIVLDSGEGETDSDVEYSGLVDFSAYHQSQAAWLKAILATPEFEQAVYRIVLVHCPPNENITPEFTPVFNLLTSRRDISLVVSGHMHEAGIWLPEETGLPFPLARCGGSSADDMAALSVHLGAQVMELKIIGLDGTVWERAVLPR
jgi:predicted MPP superfamily phosphohydrolase